MCVCGGGSRWRDGAVSLSALGSGGAGRAACEKRVRAAAVCLGEAVLVSLWGGCRGGRGRKEVGGVGVGEGRAGSLPACPVGTWWCERLCLEAGLLVM